MPCATQCIIKRMMDRYMTTQNVHVGYVYVCVTVCVRVFGVSPKSQ